ncbi:hypothetical protein O3M35_005308 [Rhynocoris fuscipes]|uniref:Uncharacterized protein n=1 Tax=Rhynocoris fuscipes TaxID=488301 RepID=A0AAW1DJN3_9HEMI
MIDEVLSVNWMEIGLRENIVLWKNEACSALGRIFRGYEEDTRTPMETDGRLGLSDKGSAFNIYLPNMKMYKHEEKST